jgi:hypothetical protein
MPTIKNPTIKNFDDVTSQLGKLPLRGDDDTAKKYVEVNNLGTLTSYTTTNPKFSNDGGVAYNRYLSGVTYDTYWGNTGITYAWVTEYGYYPIIDTIEFS